MMFMMPMPPTSRVIAATETSMMFQISMVRFGVLEELPGDDDLDVAEGRDVPTPRMRVARAARGR